MDRVAQSQPVSAPERAVGEAQSSALFWTPERQAALVAMAREGLTGSEIASALGTTRSAVLGRCHRTGVVLPMDERKRKLKGAPRARRPRPLVRARKTDSTARHRKRPWGARAYTDAEIVQVLAAVFAGLSHSKAAALVGANRHSIPNWRRDKALMERAREVADRALHEAGIVARRRASLATLERAAEAARIAAHNAPILAHMPPRHRTICERRITGENGQAIADGLGISRERVRQITVRWQSAGLIVPNAREPSSAARARYGHQPTAPRRRRAPGLKRAYRMSDAERLRRAEWMREVARRRWEVRP